MNYRSYLYHSVIIIFICVKVVSCGEVLHCCKKEKRSFSSDLSAWQGSWSIFPTMATWSMQTRIPMTSDQSDLSREERGKFRVKKRFKKFILPLLLAYKLKFFTLIPVLIGGLVLLTGATGLAGFFFALFAAVMGLKSGHGK